MLHLMPRHFPPLDLMLEDIGRPAPAALAKSLGATERTVRQWMRANQAPMPVMLAIFWITRWGQSAVHCQAHNDAVMHAGMARCLREEVATLTERLDRLGRIADFGAANDPAPGVRTPPPPPDTAPEAPPRRHGKPRKTVGTNHGETKQPRGLQHG